LNDEYSRVFRQHNDLDLSLEVSNASLGYSTSNLIFGDPKPLITPVA